MMKFHPIEAFKNPTSRPRAIIWTGTVLTFLCLFVAFMVGATTTYWFCAEICHKVQDDAVLAYQNSSHAKVSCVSCHMPAGADPVTYLLHKVEALAELVPTIANTYEVPLNPVSEVAMNGFKFPSTQCTQCHIGGDTFVTPSAGIIINHDKHTAYDISCTVCHNRVAHREEGDYSFVCVSPEDGHMSPGHANFMSMSACYRCHRLEDDGLSAHPSPFKKASGKCSVCHPKDFDLVPASHKEEGFIKEHGALAAEEAERVAEASAEVEEVMGSLHGHEASDAESQAVKDVPNALVINACYTCHTQSSCNDCHGGVSMPHPDGFLADHKTEADANMKACTKCHGGSEKTSFCSSCHHGEKSNWDFDAQIDWTTKQHATAVGTTGVAICTTGCHSAQFCADCHTARNIVPASHQAANFTYPARPALTVFGKTPAKATAAHAVSALKSTESCAVCHGDGGANSKFCKDCHGVDLPHEASFKSQHSKSKKETCVKCHNSANVCSDCHHSAAAGTQWYTYHAAVVKKGGDAAKDCYRCHQETYCAYCHVRVIR